ncbi:beta-galactosidase [Mollicutes bacterium LVI A0039]|nr:beta-galactosidase [Mollicutes bacterium LVI A0039]
MKFDRFLHGGDYNPEQWFENGDYKEPIEADIIKLKESGINFVTVGVFNWAIINPSEDNYNFEYMDYAVKRYSEEGFDIIMSTPTGGFPNWLKKKYPSINRVDSNGIRRTLGDRHNHCYNSPDTRREISKINEVIAQRYKDSKITLWHISNEMQGQCFCKHCQNEFQNWLKEKYQTIEKLNFDWNMNFWSHTYNDFSEINPPFDFGDGSNPCMRLAWTRFNTYSAVQMYNHEVQAIHKYVPSAKHTTNLCYGLGHNFNYHTLAKHMDIVSWDSYHEWHRNDDWETAMYGILNFDLMRGMKQQNFFLMESTPNTANWRYASKNKREKMNEITSLLSIAFGSQSVGYFQMKRSRNHAEMFHSAVIDDFVAKNRFTRELKELGDKLAVMTEILDTEVKNDIAIIFDYEIRDIINYNVGPRKIGGMQYCEYFEEVHQSFIKKGVNVDVVNLNCDLTKYKALVIPMHFMLSDKQIEMLEKLAAAGTKLYITAFTGITDSENNLRRGGLEPRFAKLLGHDLVEYEAIYDEDYSVVELNGETTKTKIFHEYKELHQGTVSLCKYDFDLYDNTPMITRNNNVVHFGAIVCGEVVANLVTSDLKLVTTESKILKATRENKAVAFDFYFNFTKEELSANAQGTCIFSNQYIENPIIKPYDYLIVKRGK